jgi:predicted dinucleotide-binding enzyme
MVVVAVVGGTGSVGKTIVEAFKADGTHEVIVIGRKVSSSKPPISGMASLTTPRFLKESNLSQPSLSTMAMWIKSPKL